MYRLTSLLALSVVAVSASAKEFQRVEPPQSDSANGESRIRSVLFLPDDQGRSVEGDTFDATTLVQDGIGAVDLDSPPDNFAFVSGTGTDNGDNVYSGAAMELYMLQTLIGPNTYRVQIHIYTVDRSPWVPGGTVGPSGVPFINWRMDVGHVNSEFTDYLDPGGPFNVLDDGYSTFAADGTPHGDYELALPGDYASGELGGLALRTLGGGTDIAGYDLAEMAMFWEYELLPTGACCNGDTCTITGEGACVTGGGTYLGDDATCSPVNPCLVQTGACCDGDTCTVMTEDDCSIAGGTYVGDDTTCSPVNPCITQGVLFYSNRAAWEAAAGGDLMHEDFNSIEEVYYEIIGGYYYFYYILLEAGHNLIGDHPLDIERLDPLYPPDLNNTIFPGASSMVVDGTNFLRASVTDLYGPFYLHLPEPVTAYAGDFRSTTSAGGLVMTVNGDDYHFTDLIPGGDGTGFMGIVSSEPFSRILFWTTDPWYGCSFGHDNLSWAPAPVGGACCLTDGSCAWVTEGECVAQGGTFQGLDTSCDMDLCSLPPGDGPVDHYEFEGNGDDSAGGDANGTVGADVSFLPGPSGDFASFGVDGIPPDNAITVPQADAFAPGAGDFTISFWAKRDHASAELGDGVMDALSGTGIGYQVLFNADDYLKFRMDGDAGTYKEHSSAAVITDSDWHHYALVIERTRLFRTRIYIDGALDRSSSNASLTGSIAPNQDLLIGTFNNGTNKGLDGGLDDLRFYSRALSMAEVEVLASVPGDLDGDGYVDLDDHAILAACMAGPSVTAPPPGCGQGDFTAADLSGDEDVDLQDFALFQRAFGEGSR